MCVFYFKRQTQRNNASLFSTRKKEKRENEERSENWRGMKKTSGTRVYALFLDNSGFYWIIPRFPTNKGASQICSGERVRNTVQFVLSCLSSHNFATSFQ